MLIRKRAEVVIGVLYAIGAGFQAFGTLRHSADYYSEMADQAWLRPAQVVADQLLVPNSVAVTILLVGFQAAVAIAILTRGVAVKPALVAGGAFSIIGALFGNPAETVGYGALAVLHFKLSSAR